MIHKLLTSQKWSSYGPRSEGFDMRLKTGTALALMVLFAVVVDRLRDGEVFSLISLMLIGLIYSIRDYLQALVGDYSVVLPMMLVVVVVAACTNEPYETTSAVLIGFCVSWSVFSQMRWHPFHERLLYSGLCASFVDTVIFLSLTDQSMFGAFLEFPVKSIPIVMLSVALRNEHGHKRPSNP